MPCDWPNFAQTSSFLMPSSVISKAPNKESGLAGKMTSHRKWVI